MVLQQDAELFVCGCNSIQLSSRRLQPTALMCKKLIMAFDKSGWTMDSYNQQFASANILRSSACNLPTRWSLVRVGSMEAIKGFRLILSRGKYLAVKQVKSLATNWIQIPPHFSAKIDSDKPALLPPYLSMEIFG